MDYRFTNKCFLWKLEIYSENVHMILIKFFFLTWKDSFKRQILIWKWWNVLDLFLNILAWVSSFRNEVLKVTSRTDKRQKGQNKEKWKFQRGRKSERGFHSKPPPKSSGGRTTVGLTFKVHWGEEWKQKDGT